MLFLIVLWDWGLLEYHVKYNRDFIGIELDKEYFNIAESRIKEYTLKGII